MTAPDTTSSGYDGALRWLAVQEQATELQRAHHDWRRGQALFNALHGMHPELADLIRGTADDPFHNDSRERVQAFASAVMDPPAEPCRQCGPGYRIGDEGCRHTPPAVSSDQEAERG